MKIKKLPVISLHDGLDTIAGMFEGCDDIEEVAGFENVDNVYITESLFRHCANLKVVHNISFPNAEECQVMFASCRKLKHIGIIDLPKCKYAANMLDDCPELVHIDSMNVGEVRGSGCPVDIDDASFGIREVLPSADKHTQELILSIINTSISNEK